MWAIQCAFVIFTYWQITRNKELQKSVLVIEDSPSQAALTRIELEKMGYLVEIAYDGAQGLEKARSFGPSVIILDCNLPKMSGVEVCKVLKTQPETRSKIGRAHV